MTDRRLFARKGERITCEAPEHHHIATFAKDAEIGTPQEASHWEAWQIQPPPMGSAVDGELNCHCGAAWWRRGAFCIEGEWRGAGWFENTLRIEPAPPGLTVTEGMRFISQKRIVNEDGTIAWVLGDTGLT